MAEAAAKAGGEGGGGDGGGGGGWCVKPLAKELVLTLYGRFESFRVEKIVKVDLSLASVFCLPLTCELPKMTLCLLFIYFVFVLFCQIIFWGICL